MSATLLECRGGSALPYYNGLSTSLIINKIIICDLFEYYTIQYIKALYLMLTNKCTLKIYRPSSDGNAFFFSSCYQVILSARVMRDECEYLRF